MGRALLTRPTRYDHIRGSVRAPVAILEYGDFECPTCKQAAAALQVLLRRFREHVRFAFRHFPLEELHPHALIAAEAGEAAGAQGSFWEMHDLLYAHQPRFEMEHLVELARHLELDVRRFADDLRDRAHVRRIRMDVKRGRRASVRAAPAFYVNGELCDVSFGMERLRSKVMAVLEAAAIDGVIHERPASHPHF